MPGCRAMAVPSSLPGQDSRHEQHSTCLLVLPLAAGLRNSSLSQHQYARWLRGWLVYSGELALVLDRAQTTRAQTSR